MGYDQFSPLAPAQVNVLCIPAGHLSPSRFQTFVQRLQNTAVVNLEDLHLPADTEQHTISPARSRFGAIVYNIGVARTTSNDSPLLFIPNEQPQIVLALYDADSATGLNQEGSADGNNDTDISLMNGVETAVKHLDESLAKLAFPWVRKLLVFSSQPISLGTTEVLVVLDTDGDPSVLAAMESISQDLVSVTMQKAEDLQSDTLADPLPEKLVNGAANMIKQLTRATGDLAVASSVESASAKTPTPSPNTIATQLQEATSKARYSIVAGMLALQIGCWADALRLLAEGANVCRSIHDSLWYARSVECALACMLMYVWTGYDFSIPAACRPTDDRSGPWKLFRTQSLGSGVNLQPGSSNQQKTKSQTPADIFISMIPGMVDTILTSYSAAFNTGKYKFPRSLLYESRVRSINTLVFLQTQHGNPDRASVGDLVRRTVYAAKHDSSVVSAFYPFRKSELTRMLTDTLPNNQLDVSIGKGIQIVGAIASSLSHLGLDRKYAFHMRRLLGILTQALNEAKQKDSSKLELRSAIDDQESADDSELDNNVTKSSIRPLLRIAASAYGEPLDIQPVISGCVSADLECIKRHLSGWYHDQIAGDIHLKLEMLRNAVNASEAASDLVFEMILISSLIRMSRRTVTISATHPNPPPYLSPDEQVRLLGNLNAAVSLGEKYGEVAVQAPYWDDFLVRDVDVFESDPNTKLTSHAPRDLSVVEKSDETSLTDPFIYNPFAKASTQQKVPVLVCQELATFTVTLQNTLEVDIEIENISLFAEGCDFEPTQHSIVLGHLCSQSFVLTGTPRQAGTLKIVGCKATVRSCQEQEFFVFKNDWRVPEDGKEKSVRARKSRGVSVSGDADRRSLRDLSEVSMPQNEVLTIKVIDQLPKLQVSELSISQPSLELLEGEMKTVEMTLKNESQDIQADFVLFTFEDSVSTKLQEVINQKDLHPTETYEIQYQMYANAAIKAADDKTYRRSRDIYPRSESKFIFQIYGRMGLNEVSIQTDYTRLGSARSEVKETFYTRQLRFPFDVTVNGSIEAQRCNVVPVNADLSWSGRSLSGIDQQDQAESISQAHVIKLRLTSLLPTLRADSEHELCMLLIDLRNIWPSPLNVTLQSRKTTPEDETNSWEDAYTTVDTIQPGHITRLVLLVPRVLIDDPFASIPSLATQRQFVLSSNKLGPEIEASTREAFWYREQLLKHLRGTWSDEQSGRTGEIDLRRGVRLTARMIDALRLDHVEISFSIESQNLDAQDTTEGEEHPSFEQIGRHHYRVPTDSFARLRVYVRNRASERLRLLLRLQPSLRNQPFNIALDLSNRFVWTGLLQQALHPALEPGQTTEVDLGFVALVEGQFEVNASVEEVRGRSMDKSKDLGGLRSERRIWHARTPCRIDAAEKLI